MTLTSHSGSTHCAPSFIASAQTLLKYARLMEAGCCSQEGLDLLEIMRLYGKAVDYDYHVHQTFGTNAAFAIQLGALQLLTLNHNGGQLATELPWITVTGQTGGNIYWEGIVNSPWTGLPYDVTVKYDCGKVHMIVESNVQVIGMPVDMYPVGHRMEGVTFR
jgi:hypothetical protein